MERQGWRKREADVSDRRGAASDRRRGSCFRWSSGSRGPGPVMVKAVMIAPDHWRDGAEARIVGTNVVERHVDSSRLCCESFEAARSKMKLTEPTSGYSRCGPTSQQRYLTPAVRGARSAHRRLWRAAKRVQGGAAKILNSKMATERAAPAPKATTVGQPSSMMPVMLRPQSRSPAFTEWRWEK